MTRIHSRRQAVDPCTSSAIRSCSSGQELLAQLGQRAWSFRQLRDEVICTAVVGSQAWGLAGPDSDEDIRGCFVAPFDAAAGLWVGLTGARPMDSPRPIPTLISRQAAADGRSRCSAWALRAIPIEHLSVFSKGGRWTSLLARPRPGRPSCSCAATAT